MLVCVYLPSDVCLCACVAALQLQEADKHWEFDTLLQQVAQAMQADIDKLEAEDGDDAPASR